MMKLKHVKIKNLQSKETSGRIEGVIFQKNGVIREDRRYMTKYMLKKLAKDRP